MPHTPDALRRAAGRGAAWLDAYFPGWWRRVDPRRLQMDKARRCVLGQVFGDYSRGLERAHYLGALDSHGLATWGASHGFAVSLRVARPRAAYQQLTLLWREVITQRLNPQLQGVT